MFISHFRPLTCDIPQEQPDKRLFYLFFAGDGMAASMVFVTHAKGELGVVRQIFLVMVRILGGVGAQFVTDRVQHFHVQLLHLIKGSTLRLAP